MKKIFSVASIFTAASLIMINETSCFCNKRDKTYATVIDKISNAQNVLIRDDAINPDTSNIKTKTEILNKIGLTNEEQQYVISLSGNLVNDTKATISFNISQKINSQSIYKTIKQDITWQQINLLNDDMNTEIDYAQNLSLVNDQQLVISGMSKNYISDSNLDFSKKIPINIASQGITKWFSYLDKKIYVTSTNTEYIESVNLVDDGTGNYYPDNQPTESFDLKDNSPNETSVSDDRIYISAVNNNIKDDKNINEWTINKINDYDLTREVTVFAPMHDKSQCIWNIDGLLYVGTKNGLYETVTGKSCNLLTDSTIDVKSIVASNDTRTIVFATENNLYESSDGITFNSIYSASNNINANSLFISQNNNLYFGEINKGLYKMSLDEPGNIQQITAPNIDLTSNIKNITQTNDGTLLILTNANVVYLQE